MFKGDVEHLHYILQQKWLKSILEFDNLLDFAGIWGCEAGDMTEAGTCKWLSIVWYHLLQLPSIKYYEYFANVRFGKGQLAFSKLSFSFD